MAVKDQNLVYNNILSMLILSAQTKIERLKCTNVVNSLFCMGVRVWFPS
jgi:hypothetical protein